MKLDCESVYEAIRDKLMVAYGNPLGEVCKVTVELEIENSPANRAERYVDLHWNALVHIKAGNRGAVISGIAGTDYVRVDEPTSA